MKTHHFDINVDPSDNTMEEMQAASRPQCVEVITGLERRREWLARDKASIIAESLAEGAVISDVARRHGLRPQQLFNWRSQWRKAAKDQVLSPATARAFVPAILEDEPPSAVASLAAAALTTADGGGKPPAHRTCGHTEAAQTANSRLCCSIISPAAGRSTRRRSSAIIAAY